MKKYVLYSSQYFFNLDMWSIKKDVLVSDAGRHFHLWQRNISILDVLQSGEWKYNSIKSNNMHFDYNLHL